MKKLTLYTMLFFVSLSSVSTPLLAVEKDAIVTATPIKEVPADVTKLLSRLEEIKVIDKTTLTRTDKKLLRKEVRAIKSELKEVSIKHSKETIMTDLYPLVGTKLFKENTHLNVSVTQIPFTLLELFKEKWNIESLYHYCVEIWQLNQVI